MNEFCPVVTTSGTLYFVSARPGGIRGAESTSVYTGLETNVYVAPDERVMIVSRGGAPDTLGGDDLYVSRFVNGAWEKLRHLPAPLNSDKYEYGPSLSPDGRWLFFTSARAGTADIYRVPVSLLNLGAK